MQKHNWIKFNTINKKNFGKVGLEWNFLNMTKTSHKKLTTNIILNVKYWKLFSWDQDWNKDDYYHHFYLILSNYIDNVIRQEKETKKYKIWKVEMTFCLEQNASSTNVQANIRDIVGLVLDHHTKASHMKFLVSQCI